MTQEPEPMRFFACYIRSTPECPQGNQRREINLWLKKNRISPKNVRWYIDKSGDSDLHPKKDKLQSDILDDRVRAVVVWNLNRLSSRVKDGLNILSDWCDRSLRVVSVTQRIDIKAKDCSVIAPVLHVLLI